MLYLVSLLKFLLLDKRKHCQVELVRIKKRGIINAYSYMNARDKDLYILYLLYIISFFLLCNIYILYIMLYSNVVCRKYI